MIRTSGGCAGRYRSVTTVSGNATGADAMSTAFSLMEEPQIRSLLPQAGIERVHLIDARGTASELVTLKTTGRLAYLSTAFVRARRDA